jgi:DNA-binding CsgD family transcriptional regulator
VGREEGLGSPEAGAQLHQWGRGQDLLLYGHHAPPVWIWVARNCASSPTPSSVADFHLWSQGSPGNDRPGTVNEFGEEDYNKIAELATRRRPVGRLSVETRGQPWRSRRYREIMTPLGWDAELRVALVSGGLCCGFVCLHRDRSRPDFTTDEADFLVDLAPHLAEGLRRSLLVTASPVDAADDRDPGLLELDEDLQVVATNGAAERWLAELTSSACGALPEAVHSVVARLRRWRLTRRSPCLPRLRVRAASERWLVLHASRLRGSERPGRIAVVVEPAAPVEIAPLIAQAYGLSQREQEICRMVIRGLSTSAIADGLHISSHTVQDHLKAVFDKVGVRSRCELVGQVFLRHYWPMQGSGLGQPAASLPGPMAPADAEPHRSPSQQPGRARCRSRLGIDLDPVLRAPANAPCSDRRANTTARSLSERRRDYPCAAADRHETSQTITANK